MPPTQGTQQMHVMQDFEINGTTFHAGQQLEVEVERFECHAVSVVTGFGVAFQVPPECVEFTTNFPRRKDGDRLFSFVPNARPGKWFTPAKPRTVLLTFRNETEGFDHDELRALLNTDLPIHVAEATDFPTGASWWVFGAVDDIRWWELALITLLPIPIP